MARQKPPAPSISLATFFGVAWVPLGFLSYVALLLLNLLALPHPVAVALLAAQAASLAVPLDLPPPRWARRFLAHSVAASRAYYPISLIWEAGQEAFAANRPYVIGYEPHSVLPLGGCVFTPFAAGMPAALTNTVVASTSTLFLTPLMRHMAHWMGCRPASRAVLADALAGGRSVFVCPGGVAECFYMSTNPDEEVVYLRRRTGFVRLAIEAGAPLVPVFAFGQTPHFSFWRPFIDWPSCLVPRGAMQSFVRRIGYVPMICWGYLGSALPRQVHMHVVIGAPIEVPRQADPSPELVQRYLERYIGEIQALFEAHKVAAGHPAATLTVV